MENIEFIKMHGLGNDFVIIDQRINKIKISKVCLICEVPPRNVLPQCCYFNTDSLFTLIKHS